MIKILLVEDDLVNQKLATQLLTKWGMEVTIAHDGMEAIDLLQQKTFNLILMDLNMPVMDGREATSQIRASFDPYFRNVPILAYTASSSVDSKEKAEKLGMNDFVSKPLDPPQLHFKITQYLLNSSVESRPLRVKFEVYAENDNAFKSEMIALMIKNLRELQLASFKAYYSGDHKPLLATIHKVKSTIRLLEDQDITYAIEDLRESFMMSEKPNELQQRINHLNRCSESIIKALNEESKTLTLA
jgi:CheY-like chemotaxis protein